MSRPTSRRRLLAATAAVGTVGLGGCVTLDPAVSADFANSRVFESIAPAESWASSHLSASAKLRPAATTDLGVRKLVVVDPSGSKFWTGSVEAGQTSRTMTLPVGGTATVSAVTASTEDLVESLPVTVEGNRLF